MKRLVLTDITKTFRLPGRTVPALDGISLTVEPGEFFILLGPSGCGKSTLLNSVAGLETPDAGEIVFAEKVLFSAARKKVLSPRERNIAMVFQSYALYPHMTVAQNIAFPLKVRRTGKEECNRKVAASAEMLQIRHLLSSKPAELSGGQRQRVAIARALVREPDLFLLDEPLSNLDAQLRSTMRNSLKELQSRLGVTTLYVTHDQVEAMTLGDRIAVMRSGKIEQTGTPDDLYNEPANAFVASFIGAPPMNLLSATIVNGAAGVRLAVADRVFECPGGRVKPCAPADNGKGMLGVRPEQIRLCEPDTVDSIAVTVTGCEKTGRETIVYTRWRKHSIVLISSTTAPVIGSPLHIIIPPDACYCFVEP